MTALRHPSRPRRGALTLGVLAVVCACVVPSSVAAAPAGEVAAGSKSPLRLQVLKIPDRLNKMSAGRMLVPAGWKSKGGIVWDLRYHNVASAIMEIRAPKGPDAFETFPIFPHTWDRQGIFGFPEGSLYLGSVVTPPRSAVAYLEQMVVPAFRGRLSPRVTQRTRFAKTASQLTRQARKLGYGTRTTFDAGRVRIEYRQGGRMIQEDVYTLVSYTTTPLLPTRVMWQAESLYSFRAAKGQLDRSAALLHALLASVRLDLRWYAGYRYVQKLWVDGQMQAIRAAGALSRAIAKANEEITASIRSSYRTQQEASDRISEAFSERIRGVETYRNPFEGRDVQLPSDYSYAWVSARGEYVLSNSAGFNPNVGSTIEWRLMPTR